jgi:threonine synthase
MPLGCPACRTEAFVANLEVACDLEGIQHTLTKEMIAARQPGIWRYFEFLPINNPANIVSLGEGNTPLIPAPRIGKQLGVPNLLIKNESANPTWCFKDRLCSVAVSHALESRAPGVVASSSGNHGASASAYAARAGLPCVVLTLDSSPQTIKDLMQVYGAFVVATHKSMERWILMNALVENGWYPVTNFMSPAVGSNPIGVEGHKTIAFEIAEQLGWKSPDFVVLPVGNADGIAGIWKGFRELAEMGWIEQCPRMVAAEAFGPLENALQKGYQHVEPVPTEHGTVAYSIAGNTSATQGLRAIRASGGDAVTVSDEDIMRAQVLLGKTEGLYLEPTSATAVSALEKLVSKGVIQPEHKVVIVATSTGLKDTAPTHAYLPEVPVISADFQEFRRAVQDVYGYQLQAAGPIR